MLNMFFMAIGTFSTIMGASGLNSRGMGIIGLRVSVALLAAGILLFYFILWLLLKHFGLPV